VTWYLAFDAPVISSRVGICRKVWYEKLKNDVATDGEKKFDDTFSRFDAIPACDGQTYGHLATASPRYIHLYSPSRWLYSLNEIVK